jgi:hypothetical protein
MVDEVQEKAKCDDIGMFTTTGVPLTRVDALQAYLHSANSDEDIIDKLLQEFVSRIWAAVAMWN